MVDKVYIKYYEKQLAQQVLEKTLKKNDSIFNTYCAIKELIKGESMGVDYVQSMRICFTLFRLILLFFLQSYWEESATILVQKKC